MYLLESMGTTVSVNPYTYEPDVRHPILNVGSSHCSIKQPIWDWIREQHGDGGCHFGFDGNEYYIDFPTEKDVTWFKLRWLS